MMSVRHGAFAGATQALMFTSETRLETDTEVRATPFASVNDDAGEIAATPLFRRKLTAELGAGVPLITTVAATGNFDVAPDER
jgi:hypothetical protein